MPNPLTPIIDFYKHFLFGTALWVTGSCGSGSQHGLPTSSCAPRECFGEEITSYRARSSASLAGAIVDAIRGSNDSSYVTGAELFVDGGMGQV
jgi:hypothetical protein